jgi:diphthine-ammonia ligase
MQAAMSWSGGKDSCLACYKAMTQGIEISFLISLMNANTSNSMSHEIDPEIIRLQGEAIGIPVIRKEVTWPTYEQGFRDVINNELKPHGIQTIITGDIDLIEAREWNEKMAAELDISFISPCWGMEPHTMMNELVEHGFESVIVCIKDGTLPQNWIGKTINKETLKELFELTEIHPCGEKGEYHTLITDGPIFRKKITLIESKPRYKEGYWFLDVSSYKASDKEENSK